MRNNFKDIIWKINIKKILYGIKKQFYNLIITEIFFN